MVMFEGKVPVSYFRYNNGELSDYVCMHGYDSQTCGVDNDCGNDGRVMVEWHDSLPQEARYLIDFWSRSVDRGIDLATI